eukprot:TRINITY_DN9470_c1_g1_i1.p1 TRINITY_DN9470_c1_g1~~TRINITY_DN9470_c1_g1_i1.p1  ORF type:complete len:545 (-),score=86.18 TRINITY_DN9470_c1_g1_i1:84-1718(-)
MYICRGTFAILLAVLLLSNSSATQSPSVLLRQSRSGSFKALEPSSLELKEVDSATLLEAHRAADVQGRSEVFVHLFEWSWADVAKECEQWLGPKGFTAVQVSPPTEHVKGPQWWTRYQPVTYNLTSRSGDEEAFASMVNRCKAAGVDVYADVVLNHAAAGSGLGVAGNSYGSRRTPLFNPEDFHHYANDSASNCGVSDFTNATNVQFCDLQGLPDLCTECEHVQDVLSAYIERLVDLGVKGVRVDAAKHMPPGDISAIFDKAKGGDSLFKYMEITKSDQEDAVTEQSYLPLGEVIEFNYPSLLDPSVADPGLLYTLGDIGTYSDLASGSNAVVFVDNHDSQRSKGSSKAKVTYKSGDLYVLANVFMLAYPYGYPQVMSSFQFTDFDDGPPAQRVHIDTDDGVVHCGGGSPWVCEHRWPAISNMVAWRKTAGDDPVTKFQALSEDRVLLCRGEVACVVINRQDSKDWDAKLHVPMAAGLYCNVALSDGKDCPAIKVDSSGIVHLKIPPRGVVAFHSNATPTKDHKELNGQSHSFFSIGPSGSLAS